MKKYAIIVLFGLISLPLAYADSVTPWGVEPYLGYGLLGSATIKTPAGSQDGGSVSGIGIGARGSYSFLEMFWAGVDISYFPSLGYSSATGASSSGNFDGGSNILRAGLVAGVEPLALPLRFWIGYNFVNNLSDNSVSGLIGSARLNGSSFKIGAGFKPISLLSLNAEYFFTSYSSVTIGATTTNVSPGNSITQSMLVLSASAPFSF